MKGRNWEFYMGIFGQKGASWDKTKGRGRDKGVYPVSFFGLLETFSVAVKCYL